MSAGDLMRSNRRSHRGPCETRSCRFWRLGTAGMLDDSVEGALQGRKSAG